MDRLELSTGVAELRVRHGNDPIRVTQPVPEYLRSLVGGLDEIDVLEQRRYTEAELKVHTKDGYVVYLGQAVCNPLDQFNRKKGRDLAGERLLEDIRREDLLSKADRDIVFRAVAPHLFPPKKSAESTDAKE